MESTVKATIEFKINLELTENEARAWDAIVGYGWEEFEKVFMKSLGTHYIQPYRKEAKAMFEHTRKTIGSQIYAIEEVRKAIANINNKDNIQQS